MVASAMVSLAVGGVSRPLLSVWSIAAGRPGEAYTRSYAAPKGPISGSGPGGCALPPLFAPYETESAVSADLVLDASKMLELANKAYFLYLERTRAEGAKLLKLRT